MKDKSIVFPKEISLLTLDGFTPSDFLYGIEIYNDNTTPMEFVVNTLEKNININRKEAINIMLTIHTKGGVIVSLPSFAEAIKASNSIMADAKVNNHELFCRAINTQQGAQAEL